jgi:hypothetical protein
VRRFTFLPSPDLIISFTVLNPLWGKFLVAMYVLFNKSGVLKGFIIFFTATFWPVS